MKELFIDKVRITFLGGQGGSGGKHFDFNQRPDGGNGGDGGSIFLEPTISVRDLRQFSMGPKKIRAASGEKGGKNKLTGARGANMIIKVPIGTHIYKQSGEYVGDVDKLKKKFLVAKGGRGGIGNFQFRSAGRYVRDKTTPGTLGDTLEAILELRLTADIAFVGFPNAGKSSMLNALTNANVKVADYAFTTMIPHIGSTAKLKLMDLPGLIEGTVEGKGVGTRFTKHAEQASLIAHFVSLESEDIEKDYLTMRKELEEISKNLFKKPEIIVLTKSDLFEEDHIAKQKEILEKHNKNIVAVSAYKYEQVEELRGMFENEIDKITNTKS